MISAQDSSKWQKLCRWCCLTVAFPVGIGTGLLPRPMVVWSVETAPLHQKAEEGKQAGSP